MKEIKFEKKNTKTIMLNNLNNRVLVKILYLSLEDFFLKN